MPFSAATTFGLLGLMAAAAGSAEVAPHTIWASSAWPALNLTAAPAAPLRFERFDAAMANVSAELDGLGLSAVAFDASGHRVLARTYGWKYCKTVEWCDGFEDGALGLDTQIPVFSNTKIVSVCVFLATVGVRGLDVPLRESLPDPFAAPDGVRAPPRRPIARGAIGRGLGACGGGGCGRGRWRRCVREPSSSAYRG